MKKNSAFILVMLSFACVKKDSTTAADEAVPKEIPAAEVLSVEITGFEGDYTFSVEIKSPDTGCDQYADWWEVVSLDTVLLYRRILTHSHVNEQPFKRPGGPVNVKADQSIIIRAHMNNSGYGSQALKGSVQSGFTQATISASFGKRLETEEPLPGDCGF